MKDFSSIYLTEPNKNTESDTNEVVGVILATVILSQAFMGLGSKDSKGGGSGFWDWMINRQNSKKEKEKERAKEKESKSSSEKNTRDNEAFNMLLMIARKSNQKEKDANTRKKNDAMIKLLTACSFDKDGNEIPLDQRLEKMKGTMSPEQFEAFKKEMTATYEKNKDNQEFRDAVAKEAAKITPETYEKSLEAAKKEAIATLDQIAKEKAEIEKWEKELADMEASLEGETDDSKKKSIKAKIKDKMKLLAQSLVGAAIGAGSEGSSTEEPSEETTEEPTKETTEEPAEETTEEPTKETTEEPAEETTEEPAEETTDGEYAIKDEEVTDPKTGKKKKVKTYTGPRGGKFYYPDGAPKKTENRVYVEHLSLSDYLTESLM
jgi:hypothetical protein